MKLNVITTFDRRDRILTATDTASRTRSSELSKSGAASGEAIKWPSRPEFWRLPITNGTVRHASANFSQPTLYYSHYAGRARTKEPRPVAECETTCTTGLYSQQVRRELAARRIRSQFYRPWASCNPSQTTAVYWASGTATWTRPTCTNNRKIAGNTPCLL
jgi:hypothetical protein